MANWPYSTSAWSRLRALKLRQSPLCEVCLKRDRVVPANIVDHIRAIRQGGDPFPCLDGLMSVCARCHNDKTNALDKTGGSGVAIKGCDVNGMPLDSAHPFFGGDLAPYTPSKDEQLRPEDRRNSRAGISFGKRR